ncbi:MAG: hypothetical protein CFE21_09325 [Bacteroidetes bacterium B1(2017)]|nr:MAG: hypothetical protein CFE21_09325 [Bacteroidetes bacterium B1(2017)]
MKQLFPLLLLFLFACNSSNDKQTINTVNTDSNTLKTSIDSTPYLDQIDTCLLGDINADKIIDTAFVLPPKFEDPMDIHNGGCVNDDCTIKVRFSNGLPQFSFGQAISGRVYNIQDIDKDGISEILLCPGWFQGCWGLMRFYSLKNNVWEEFGSARAYMCDDENIAERVRIINKKTIDVSEDILDDTSERVKRTKRIFLKN